MLVNDDGMDRSRKGDDGEHLMEEKAAIARWYYTVQHQYMAYK